MLYDILMLAQVIIAAFLVIVILLQRSDGGMGSLGGEGGGAVMSGQSVGDVMTRVTTWLGVAFMGVCLVLATQSSGRGGESSVIDAMQAEKAVEEKAAMTPSVPAEVTDVIGDMLEGAEVAPVNPVE
ncbi:MAG: preprotein translocase subunit SecG [Alphaproteobacteria bacterium]|nr:preprotein translocase subunit SecG [Alphaproteobacteria bacterium]